MSEARVFEPVARSSTLGAATGLSVLMDPCRWIRAQRHPQVHAQRALIDLRDYERRFAALSRAPDAALVERVRRAIDGAGD